jgi:hypothetical protein
MKVEIDSQNNLVIRIPINKPLSPSSTGKSLIVASSGGNKETACEVEGKRVIVGVNAYVKL